MLRRIVGAVGIVGFSAAGCTTLLGDFSDGPPSDGIDAGLETGVPGDGGADAVVDGSKPADGGDSAAPPGCTGTGAPVCGLYSTCVAGPACACVTGYVDGDGGMADGGDAACGWSGLPLDPGFEGQPAGAWTVTNGTFSPTASTAGQIDPGNVTFIQSQICPAASSGLGSVQQKFRMPSYADSQPFGLRLSGAATCDGQDCGSQGIGFDINGGFLSEALGGSPSPLVLCLGERAYGGEVTLTLTPSADACFSGADANYTALIDHVDIEPVTGCPVPGVITNADFESAAGWAVSSPTTGTCSSSAAVANGDGTAGTRGGMVESTCEGSVASVSEGLSIPYTETPNLALQVDFNDTGSDVAAGLDLGFGGHSLGNLSGAGQRTGKVCIPAWAEGLADTLSFNLPQSSLGYHGGNSSEYRNFTFDNLVWVSDPSCPATPLVIDPGFERGDSGRAWQFAVSHDFNSTPKAEIIADPAAHGGANSMHLYVDLGSETAYASTTVTVPSADATGGPVLTVWYKLTTTTQVSLSTPFGTLASASTWTQATVCLDPYAAGHAFDVQLRLEAFGSVNSALTPAVDAYVDDLAVGTSASCPKN